MILDINGYLADKISTTVDLTPQGDSGPFFLFKSPSYIFQGVDGANYSAFDETDFEAAGAGEIIEDRGEGGGDEAVVVDYDAAFRGGNFVIVGDVPLEVLIEDSASGQVMDSVLGLALEPPAV